MQIRGFHYRKLLLGVSVVLSKEHGGARHPSAAAVWPARG